MRFGALIFNPLLKSFDVFLEKQNDLVFCNSQHSAADYEKSYRKKPHAVVYPPSYVKNKALSANKQNYIFTVSRLSKFKNVDLLIEAFANISPKFPDYSLIIAGTGEEKNALEKMALEMNLEKHVKFPGKVSTKELEELYANARATVICSKNEPFGLIPIESMMHSTPIIAHRSGGPLETILDEKTGFLFSKNEELSVLLEKIITLAPEKYFAMQKACQEQAGKFDISASIKKLEEILNGV